MNGEEIAKELGIHYDGIRGGIRDKHGKRRSPDYYVFVDRGVTGTSFYGNTLEEARESLQLARRRFGISEDPAGSG